MRVSLEKFIWGKEFFKKLFAVVFPVPTKAVHLSNNIRSFTSKLKAEKMNNLNSLLIDKNQ
jgi:hypothetical protein